MRIEQIGDATLYLGDCREIFPVLDIVDTTITDPPYGISGGRGTLGKRGRAAQITWEDTEEDVREVYAPAVREALRLSGGRGAITPGARCAFAYPAPKDIGAILQPAATGCSSWGRATMQPVLFYGPDPHAGKHLSPVTFTQIQPAEKCDHPTPKPLAVMRWLVARASRPDWRVLDPFMGSGTTGVACLSLGRSFIGIELDERYFEESCRRIEEAHRQPRLFEEPGSKVTQASIFD